MLRNRVQPTWKCTALVQVGASSDVQPNVRTRHETRHRRTLASVPSLRVPDTWLGTVSVLLRHRRGSLQVTKGHFSSEEKKWPQSVVPQASL